MNRLNISALVYYLVAAAVLIIYSTQICPFLDQLSTQTLAGIIAGGLGVAFLLRLALLPGLVRRSARGAESRRQLFGELFCLVLAGILVAVYNRAAYGFPFGSGAKVILGCTFFGIFASLDQALGRERLLAESLAAAECGYVDPKRIFPITRKSAIIASAVVVCMCGVLVLIHVHDIRWIRSLPPEADLGQATRAVVIEVVFAMLVLLLLTLRLIWAYSHNLDLYFSRQTEVLQAVSGGRLDGHVPVTSNDEFGLIARGTNEMIQSLRARTDELQRTQTTTITALASLAETRDNETGQHIVRTQHYVRALAEALCANPRFAGVLDEETIELLFLSAPLHDIGKVGVADRILLKPGKLTAEEFEEMKRHTLYGRDTLARAEETMGGPSSFLRVAREIAFTHHERWDGTGYPQGLAGDAIPVSGRLMALADVYDALISKRVYKPAFTHEKAKAIIVEGRESHFDPDVVDAFLELEAAFVRIRDAHADRESD